MNDSEIPPSARHGNYPSAAKGVADSKKSASSPQTRSPSYRLAFGDHEFLLRNEMRGVRLQLEYEKADLHQALQGVSSTIVVFGGARIVEPKQAEAGLREAEVAASGSDDPARLARVERARRTVANSRFYEEARELARLASATGQCGDECYFVVTTGGGPGIMEAANRGAAEVGAKSVGLNIVLPREQSPNPYITPDLCFQFHYFALRKMHFLMRAKALVCFPGGFGTMDELFEALTLIQTGKIEPLPVVLVGREHWSKAVDFDHLVAEGFIAAEDLSIFEIVETGREAWDLIRRFYAMKPK